MIDPVTALRWLFQDEAALTALTEADTDKGIYRASAGFPAGKTTIPRAVVINLVPGVRETQSGVIAPRAYLRFYAPSSKQALELYRVTWDMFHDQHGVPRGPRRIRSRYVLRSASLSMPSDLREPDTDWPVVLATLDARFNALEV
jgi:hypothetical protein